MRDIEEVLRLSQSFSARAIARSLAISPTTVSDYLRRAAAAGVSYPLPAHADADWLERRLYPPAPPSGSQRPEPDWTWVHAELRKKHVTLDLLWREYKQAHPEGYQYSHFCELYRHWARRIDVTMRQIHIPGEKVFVDYAGTHLEVIDAGSGEIKPAQLFVAACGASNYTYAEATWTQSLEDWLGSHVRAFEFFGGVPKVVVPDNLKSGVNKPCYFSPEINPSYLELARHYGVVILPARVAKPKDKAKVESAVLVASRWIIAALRNQRFFSLAELNTRIAQLLIRLNERPFKKLPGCRKSVFTATEQVALTPLPRTRYTFADWMLRRAGIDYHVEIFGHYYSVPYTLAKQQLDARITAHTVEIFLRGKRVASHVRSRIKGGHSTQDAHMPAAHLRFKNYTPDRFLKDAQRIGPHTHAVIKHLLSKRKHPEQGFRACLGVLRLGHQHSGAKLEAACDYALQINAPNFRSIASILKNGLTSSQAQTSLLPAHDNVRGPTYYH